ncbi:DUF5130 domain-containing protein [Gordonia jinhuaensis]|uniref:DUF5130 family protein n=1 Tax=Gordonia jinhuaensis TaxID=1517702 RepID=UPI001E4E300F|nr:DUF5130 family protein [Gordonia jinhuaensis]
MASGEVEHASISSDDLPVGAVVTSSGRISAARFPGSTPTTPPFTRDELVALDDALTDGTERALVRFSVYIGELGDDAVAGAGAILPSVPEHEHAVLIAVSPNTREVAVVSGAHVADRVNDRVCGLGITAAIASFKANQLIDGVIAAIRVITSAVAPI